MSINVKVPAAISAGKDFIVELAAQPPGSFEITITVNDQGRQFGLERGTLISLPKASKQTLAVGASGDWVVTELDIQPGDTDFTVTLTESGAGTRSDSESGEIEAAAADA